MLGRKAILHTAKQGKRKWQLEQENSDDEDGSSDAGGGWGGPGPEDAGERDRKSGSESKGHPAEKRDADAGGADDGLRAAKGAPRGADRSAASSDGKEKDRDEDDDIDDDDDGGGKRRKQFAWMDSDDELSDGEDHEETGHHAAVAARNCGSGFADPGLNSGVLDGAMPSPNLTDIRPALAALLRPPLRPTLILPPRTRLPSLTPGHLSLMLQIVSLRTLNEVYDFINTRVEECAAAHVATALYRLAVLSTEAVSVDPDIRVEKHSSFSRLCARVDELLATAESRESFMAADLAMVVAALAKLVRVPVKEGVLARIFAEVADEAEARIAVDAAAFTPPMLGDLAWGIWKGGDVGSGARIEMTPELRRFFDAVIKAALARLPEMTCQDLANLAAAYADNTREDADALLRGVFTQTRLRLSHQLQDGAGAAAKQAPSIWQQLGLWKFSGAQVSEIAGAAAKHVNLYDEGLFDHVAKTFRSRLHELTVPQLQKLRDSFDTVRHDRDVEFLKATKSALKQRENRRRCDSFRRGLCKFGDRCVYSHDP